MAEKLEKYNVALTALLEEAIRCSPQSWTQGTLTIECDGHRINYWLKNDQGAEKAHISQKLAQLCEEYWSVFQDYGDGWVEAKVEFFQEDGAWTFNAAYKRPDKVREASKRSWKFWQ